MNQLSKINPEKLCGIDILDELLSVSRAKLPNVLFRQADVNSPDFSFERKYDVGCLMGVLQIFDNPVTPLSNMFSMINPGGAAIIVGPFNEDPVTLITRYYDFSTSKEQEDIDAELGWNIFCFEQMRQIVNAYDRKLKVDFKEVVYPDTIKLEKREEDVMRSWTVNLDGTTKFLNGTSILQDHFIMTVTGFSQTTLILRNLKREAKKIIEVNEDKKCLKT